jgi:pectate lyase
MEGNREVTDENWSGGIQTRNDSLAFKELKLDKPWLAMPINQQSAKDAYKLVLENAGATLPQRDVIDTRIVKEVKEGTFKSQES